MWPPGADWPPPSPPRCEKGLSPGRYLPARRCQRVAFNIFLCFFFRMRLRRFLMSDPMSGVRLTDNPPTWVIVPPSN